MTTGTWIDFEDEFWRVTGQSLEPHATLGEATIVTLENEDGDRTRATLDELADCPRYGTTPNPPSAEPLATNNPTPMPPTTAPSTVLITGHTYPHRHRMRELGGVWNKTAQGWEIPADKADEVRALVGGPAPARSFGRGRGRSRHGSTYTRFAGGGESYTNRNGRCIDAPCCGCCS